MIYSFATKKFSANFFVVSALLLLLSACQTLPSPPTLTGYGETSIQTSSFKHLLISKPGSGTRLHVYIEGDGIPFYRRFQIAKDPTPTYPMMLAMMQQDPATSLYLGRPCYFNRTNPDMTDTRCNFHYWTNARYSNDVVASMTAALRAHLAQHPAQGVTLIGHSGGGTLAMLMAARMPEVDQLVTIAGNFDIKAWTRFHHYSPLDQSLNPQETVTQASPLHQLHFTGGRDDNIPAALGQGFLTRLGFSYILVPDADHNCCWVRDWRKLLGDITQQWVTTAP